MSSLSAMIAVELALLYKCSKLSKSDNADPKIDTAIQLSNHEEFGIKKALNRNSVPAYKHNGSGH